MDKQQEKQIRVFGFGLPLLLIFLAWRHGARHQWDMLSFGLLAVAVCVLVITLFYRRGLEFIFKYWMKVAGFIGSVVMTVLLTVLYYAVFAPVGVFLRLAGKDYMQRRLDLLAGSYWVRRDTRTVNDKQQF